MAQFGRPVSDVTDGGWEDTTGGDGDGANWDEIDEVTADDGTTFVRADSSATMMEVGLSNVTDPASSSGHIIRFRAYATGSTGPERITFTLVETTTVRATINNQSITRDSWNTYSYTLSGAEADAIGDYTDLRFRFSPTANGGDTIDVTWAEFEVPDAGATFEEELDDSQAVLDEPRYEMFLHRYGDESQMVLDEIRYEYILHQLLVDTITVVDDPFRKYVLHRFGDDSIGFLDDVFTQKVLIFTRRLDDVLNIIDEIRYLTFLHRLLADTTSITDEPRYLFTRHQNLDDSSALVDEPRYFFTRHQNLDDSSTLVDAIFTEKILILLRELSDTIGLIDVAFIEFILRTIRLSETITIVDEPRYITILFRELDDGIVVVDDILIPSAELDGVLIILERPF